ncbi:MAG: Spy/CpxP family protein refolding chaperone [Ignavibacteriaceae bacterium]|nr:Spy/CpxP family protein refolding chaperone [Ignavibacteriaceae bacterium]
MYNNFFAEYFCSGNAAKKQQFRDQIHKQLNLTDDQQTKIDELKLAHKKEMIDLKANLDKKELALAELKNKGNYSREDFLNKINDVITARNKIAISFANHQMDVYEQLDENQKKEWNKISGEFGEHREKRVNRMMKNFDDK